MNPQREVEGLFAHATGALDEALQLIIRGRLEPDRAAYEAGMARLADTIRATQTYADFLGRRRVWLEFDSASRGFHYAADDPVETPIVPNVPFEEALYDLVTREPRLASSAEEVARLYSQEHVFALARVADLRLVERIQKYLADAKREGKGEVEAVRTMADLGDFTRAYARVVYRTNLATAYSAGRKAQAAEPVVRELLPAFRFTTARDVDVRRGRPQDNGENHAALEGYLAPTDHGVWASWTPPIGYLCRCAVRLVGLPELDRIDPRGRWRRPPDPIQLGAAKHPNF